MVTMRYHYKTLFNGLQNQQRFFDGLPKVLIELVYKFCNTYYYFSVPLSKRFESKQWELVLENKIKYSIEYHYTPFDKKFEVVAWYRLLKGIERVRLFEGGESPTTKACFQHNASLESGTDRGTVCMEFYETEIEDSWGDKFEFYLYFDITAVYWKDRKIRPYFRYSRILCPTIINYEWIINDMSHYETGDSKASSPITINGVPVFVVYCTFISFNEISNLHLYQLRSVNQDVRYYYDIIKSRTTKIDPDSIKVSLKAVLASCSSVRDLDLHEVSKDSRISDQSVKHYIH